MDRADSALFDQESGKRGRFRHRHGVRTAGVGSQGRKPGVFGLQAKSAMPAGKRLMRQFPSRFQRTIREIGLRCIAQIQLRMLVIRVAKLELEGFECRKRFPDQRIDVVACLRLIDLRASSVGMP